MAPTMHPLVGYATTFDQKGKGKDDDGDEITFSLPEDYTSLSDEDLQALQEQAADAFDAIYDREGDLSSEDVEALQALADAVDAIRGELRTRNEQREQNRKDADALRRRVDPEEEGDDDSDEGDPEAVADDPAPDEGAEDPPEGGEEPAEAVAAGSISVSLSGLRNRQGRRRQPRASRDRPVIIASADLGGPLTAGDEVTVDQVAEQLIRRTQGMTDSSYRAAFDSGRRQRNSIGLLSINKSFPKDLVASADNGHEVLQRATDEKRLPQGSLVAAGGWCAPSETVYDLFELEQADGLVSIPEFQVIRGGIRFTRGPDFATLFADTGFCFTEADAEAGDFDGYGGNKPCFQVTCPDFTEERLEVCGLCITAGILQNRAYPEVTARTIRGALVAHQHRLAARTVESIIADSTSVSLPAGQVGALAPVLTAIELQAQHYRYVHRMADSATLEAIFPRWVRGVIRSDLSRRLGVDLLTVSNAQIQGWFNERGINPQFVYNYQDLSGPATDHTSWPTSIRFLLYAAGTWARGSSDVITLDAIFDSNLLVQNDFTALFSEEGWLVARRGHDSREVTVPICPDGATHGGVAINCDGT